MSFRFTAEEMNALTEQQKETILDVVIAGVLADGGALDEDEVQQFDSELRQVPWGLSEETMVAKIRASYEKIHAFTAPQQAIDLVRAAGGTLTDTNVREKTFAMLARVMYAGQQMSDAEKAVLTAFASAFDLGLPRLQQIAQAVKKEY